MVAPEQRKLGAVDWDVSLARPQKKCTQCESLFHEGSDYVSVLSLQEAGMNRAELCPPCFEKDPSPWFAFWRTRIAKVEEGRKRPLDMNFLVEFFRRLQSGVQEEKYVQVGYIVALILQRKKMLHLVRTEPSASGEVLVMKFAKDPDSSEHKVLVPVLTEDRIADIKDELTRIFNIDEAAAAR